MADMGGRIPSGAPWGRRTTYLLRAAAIAAVTLVLPMAATAQAATEATPIVPTDHGLSEPAGVAVTPDGAIWVSDGIKGLCRVSGAELVEDELGYCAPEVEVPEGQPEPGPLRPTATFQMAFDAERCKPAETPEHCNFYVAEGTSARSGVWRMHWNPVTKTIDDADQLYAAPGDNRVFGLALSPQGDVDFSSKRDTLIRRIPSPHTAEAPLVPEIVGASQAEGASSLTHLGQAIVIADGGALTKIDAPGPLGGTAVSIPVAGSPAADEAVSAVAADTVRGVVYAGTSTGALTDKVLMATADGFLPDTYDEGYANVTALGMGTGGALLIAHDPSAALSPGVDTPNLAELFSRPLGELSRPQVTFTRTPQPVQRDSAPADVVFTWVARAGATFECTVDGGAPFACGDTWSPAESLFEGAHELKVRADHGGWGPMATWHFEIDQTAPEVSIDAGTPREAVGGALRVGFTSDTQNARFECSLDEGDFRECSPAKDLAGLALGPHTFAVRATDPAGNTSEPVSFGFTSVPVPVRPWAPVPVVGSVPAPKPSQRVAGKTAKQAVLVPCAEVSPSRDEALFRLVGTRASVRFDAPRRARYAKFTLRRAAGRRASAAIVETLGYRRVRSSAGDTTTTLALTRAQRRSLRAGRTGIAIAYGTCRTQVGLWQWLQNTNQEGSQR